MHRQLKRNHWILALFCIVVSVLDLQAETANGKSESFGLRFFSNDRPVIERTSYDIFGGDVRLRGPRTTVGFQIALDPNGSRFGYILDINGEQDDFNLVLVNYKDRHEASMDLNTSSHDVKLSLPVTYEGKNGIWHDVQITFDRKADSLTFVLDGHEVKAHYDFSAFRSMNCVFGKIQKASDVASMTVRNVSIADGRREWFFPLDESSGTKVSDSRGRAYGEVLNPDWARLSHYHWKKCIDLKQKKLCGLAYDGLRHNVVIYNADSCFVWNVSSSSNSISGKPCGDAGVYFGEMVFDSLSRKMVIYNPDPRRSGSTTVAEMDYSDPAGIRAISHATVNNRLYHGNGLIDRSSGDSRLWLFGGYGKHQYSGDFYTFDVQEDVWKKVKFHGGEQIFPRFFSGMGEVSAGRYYLFGGFGNHSGFQNDGADYLYDLFEVNFADSTVKAVGQFDIPGIDFVPTPNLVVENGGKAFYTFCYDHNNARPQGALYRFDVEDMSCTCVSDTLGLVSEKIESKLALWYDEEYRRLILAVHDYSISGEVTVSLYTLDFPPAVCEEKIERSDCNLWWMWIAVFFIAGTLGWQYCRRRKSSGSQEVDSVLPEIVPDASVERKTSNAIYLIGDFRLYDRNGNDISYRLSNKLRQLFILVLLNSVGKRAGISSDEISAVIWPEKERENTGNIRRVSIKSIRDIIADLDDISLNQENSKWSFTFGPALYCDYCYLMAQKSATAKPDGAEVVSCYMRGRFLNAYNQPWLDSYKLEYEEMSTVLLSGILSDALASESNQAVLKTTSAMLSLDPLNVDVFKIELHTLKKMGKSRQAELKFHLFADEYFKAYGTRLEWKDFS